MSGLHLPPVHLCGRRIEGARHVCVFYSSRDEEYGIVAPFVKEAADQGERILQIVDSARKDDHVARMRRAGVPMDGLQEAGTLSVHGWEETYLVGGEFDKDRMLSALSAVVEDRKARGFPRLRGMGNMEWALKGAPGTEQLLEYETRVNLLSERIPDVFICTYDVTKFPASTLFDAMRTHPAVVIGGIYHENPYFVPPARMLEELVARGKAKSL